MGSSFHSPEYDQFRLLLIAARERAELTQAQVAARLSRPQSFVSKYETGERRLDVVEFVAVCRALGIKANSIIAVMENDRKRRQG